MAASNGLGLSAKECRLGGQVHRHLAVGCRQSPTGAAPAVHADRQVRIASVSHTADGLCRRISNRSLRQSRPSTSRISTHVFALPALCRRVQAAPCRAISCTQPCCPPSALIWRLSSLNCVTQLGSRLRCVPLPRRSAGLKGSNAETEGRLRGGRDHGND